MRWGPPAGDQAGKGLRWGPDLLEPLANSTLMVLPSMVSGGCKACRICSSWAASWGRRGGRGRRVRPGEVPGSIAPLPGVGPRWELGSGSLLPTPGAGTLAARPPLCRPHHDGGELDEGEATVQLGLFVLNDANIGGGQHCVGCQGPQDGVHGAVWVQVAQNDGCRKGPSIRGHW